MPEKRETRIIAVDWFITSEITRDWTYYTFEQSDTQWQYIDSILESIGTVDWMYFEALPEHYKCGQYTNFLADVAKAYFNLT